MNSSKRYYWLKLKTDFFNQKTIKKLRKIAGGDTYTVIYLKMLLLSINNGGKIIYEGVEDTFAEELALSIDEDVENIDVVLNFLERYQMITSSDTNEFLLPEAVNSVGGESAGAERVRRFRERQKALQCNTSVTACNTEIEIEIDKEKKKENKSKKKNPAQVKHHYGMYNNVMLTDEELEKLKTEFLDWEERIERLSEYVESTGKKYKSHLATIRAWARKDRSSCSRNNVASACATVALALGSEEAYGTAENTTADFGSDVWGLRTSE